MRQHVAATGQPRTIYLALVLGAALLTSHAYAQTTYSAVAPLAAQAPAAEEAPAAAAAGAAAGTSRTDEQQQPTDQAFADSGGEQAAADLLPDLAALFAADDVQAGSIPPDGAPTKQTGDAPQQAEPSQRIGQMVSLLDPPPGFAMPDLSPQQQEAAPKLRKLRQGRATVVYQRAVGNLDGANMNCGIAYLNNHFAAHFVGISQELYGSGQPCGVCVSLWCVDAACEGALVSNRTFMVTDSCADCGAGDLVVSTPGFTALTGGLNPDLTPSIQVAWAFVSCAPLIQGGIRLWPSPSTTDDFLGLQFSNLRRPLRGVALNGVKMQPTDYGYWVISTPGKTIPLRQPYRLVLGAAGGERVGREVASLRAQDLGVNFQQ